MEEIHPHLHDAGDAHGPGNDGGVALAAALGGDDAQDHAGRHAEQVRRHEQLRRQNNGVVQRQPDPGTVRQDIDHPAGGVQNVHAPQLHVGVILHVGQLLSVAAAHPVHGLGGAEAGFDLKVHLIHHAFVFQHHALEEEDGLLGGGAALGHVVQLFLGRMDGVVQQLPLPLRAEGPIPESFHMVFQQADLPQHKARGSRHALIGLHDTVTSGSAGPVRTRQTSACKNVLGSSAARAACGALAVPSNRGAKTSSRSRSHFSKNALLSVSVV